MTKNLSMHQEHGECSFIQVQPCAGDEIRWDFIHAVKTSKISFTGFCNEMTRVYKTTHTNGDPFMSVKTFGWFFWVALCIQNRFP